MKSTNIPESSRLPVDSTLNLLFGIGYEYQEINYVRDLMHSQCNSLMRPCYVNVL